MKKISLGKGITVRSAVLGFTPAMVDEFLVELTKRKETDVRISNIKSKFESLVSEWGWTSPKEFIADLGYLTPHSVAKTTVTSGRVRLTAERRAEIVETLKMGIKSTDEIASDFGVSVDLVYSVKSKAGLAAKRKPKATTSAPPLPTASLPTMEVAA